MYRRIYKTTSVDRASAGSSAGGGLVVPSSFAQSEFEPPVISSLAASSSVASGELCFCDLEELAAESSESVEFILPPDETVDIEEKKEKSSESGVESNSDLEESGIFLIVLQRVCFVSSICNKIFILLILMFVWEGGF